MIEKVLSPKSGHNHQILGATEMNSVGWTRDHNPSIICIILTFLCNIFFSLQVKGFDPSIPKSDYAHFSRPGSAYVMRSQPLKGSTSERRDLNAVSK